MTKFVQSLQHVPLLCSKSTRIQNRCRAPIRRGLEAYEILVRLLEILGFFSGAYPAFFSQPGPESEVWQDRSTTLNFRPKSISNYGMGFGTRNLEHRVLGPSRLLCTSRRTQHCGLDSTCFILQLRPTGSLDIHLCIHSLSVHTHRAPAKGQAPVATLNY